MPSSMMGAFSISVMTTPRALRKVLKNALSISSSLTLIKAVIRTVKGAILIF